MSESVIYESEKQIYEWMNQPGTNEFDKYTKEWIN